jgi:hypothetical protein
MASNTSSTDQFSASTGSVGSAKDMSTNPEDEIKNPVGKDGSLKNKSTPTNACSMCRKRKIKCDGLTPSCGRCTRMKLDCAYEETRKKSGPRKGYVRGLQTRLGAISLELRYFEMQEKY